MSKKHKHNTQPQKPRAADSVAEQDVAVQTEAAADRVGDVAPEQEIATAEPQAEASGVQATAPAEVKVTAPADEEEATAPADEDTVATAEVAEQTERAEQTTEVAEQIDEAPTAQEQTADTEQEGGDSSQPTAEEPSADQTQDEEAQRKAEEKAQRKAERQAKCKAWFQKHKWLVVCLSLVVLVGVGLTVGHFVATINVAFIHNADNLQKAVATGKKTEYIFKNDIIYNGDLTLSGVNVDLNKHTLDVKGNLTTDGNVVIGRKKTIWSAPQTGGTVLVEGSFYTHIGNVQWYSDLSVATINVEGNLAVYGTTKADSATISGDLSVAGTLQCADVAVAGSIAVSGAVEGKIAAQGAQSIAVDGKLDKLDAGGADVVVKGSVAMLSNAANLYIYPDGAVDTATDVGSVLLVQYLERPTVLVQDVNGSQELLISHVRHADGYKVSVVGGEQTYDVPDDVDADYTPYSLPDLAPGNYTIKVEPYAQRSDVYLGGACTTIDVSYYVQLETPSLALIEESRDDGTHIVLALSKVAHASAYVLTVDGKDYTYDAKDDLTVDITDKVSAVGTYDVYVYAKPAKKSNYKASEVQMITYVKTAESTATVSVSLDAGIWQIAIEGDGHADYFQLQFAKDGTEVDSAVVLKATAGKATYSLAYTEAYDAVIVTPLVNGYYSAQAQTASLPVSVQASGGDADQE